MEAYSCTLMEKIPVFFSSFKELVQQRKCFVTEKGIQQYLGLIQNNYRMLDKDKDGASKDRKLLYQVCMGYNFHPLSMLNPLTWFERKKSNKFLSKFTIQQRKKITMHIFKKYKGLLKLS